MTHAAKLQLQEMLNGKKLHVQGLQILAALV
jgi:hypothetical protein